MHLEDPRASWGGVRHADGTVVMSLWADSIKSRGGTCGYLLWAPNTGGSRPWSDTPGGKERLEHCRIALERGAAEGLLIHGKRTPGAPGGDGGADGVDAETVLELRVDKRGEEYWAVCVTEGSAKPDS